MPRGERLHLHGVAEEMPEEVLDVRRDCDQQVRFRLERERCGIGAARGEPLRERCIRRREMGEEVLVDAPHPRVGIEIGEGEAVG